MIAQWSDGTLRAVGTPRRDLQDAISEMFMLNNTEIEIGLRWENEELLKLLERKPKAMAAKAGGA